MQKLNTIDVINKIERNRNPGDTNLSNSDLSGVDLGRLKVESLKNERDVQVTWWSNRTLGINLRGIFLRDSVLNYTDLSGADLREADLRNCKFISADLKNADLAEAKLEGADMENANLSGANIEGTNLLSVKSLSKVFWYQAILRSTRFTRSQLGETIGEESINDYEKAREAYLLLKNNFIEIGRYDDAGWAYFKERKMERLTHKPSVSKIFFEHQLRNLPKNVAFRKLMIFKFYLFHTSRYLRDWAFEISSDYGENIWKFFSFSVILLLLFSFTFWFSCGVGSTGNVSRNFWDYVLFTLSAFETTSLPGLNALNYFSVVMQLLAGAIGIGIFATIMFMLGNKVNRK